MDDTHYDKYDSAIEIVLKHGLADNSPVLPPPHYHNTHEICFFVHSTVRAFMQNTWYDVTDGDIVIVPQHELHRYEYLNTDRYTRLLITFSDEYLRTLLAQMHCPDLFDSLQPAKCMQLRPRSTKFRKLYQQAEDVLASYKLMTRKPSEENLAVFRARFFCLLFDLRQLITEKTDTADLSKASECVQRTINYIDEHYMLPLTLEDLAKTALVDKYHLCHIFKQHTGMTAVKYIHTRRIIEAEKQLLYTDLATDAIAAAVGFSTMQHFYRVFREVTGTSPGEYREKNKIVV